VTLGRIDKALDRPAFQQIADELRRAVQAGEYRPGDGLPSEAQLMDHFGVARMTVRQALQVLKGEGLVVAEHGRGVFVRQRPPVRRLASDRFARAHREQGKAAFTAESEADSRAHAVDRLTVSTALPPLEVRQRLGLTGRDRVVVRDRRYLSDGRPVETAVSYIPADIARGTKIADPDSGPGGIYARLEELGHRLARFTEEVEARMPTPVEASALGLGPGVPVIHLVRVAYDDADRAVEVCDTVMAADAFVLNYDVPAL